MTDTARRTRTKLWLVCLGLLILSACATSPLNYALILATEDGATVERLTGVGHEHLVVSHNTHEQIDELHLYIGGDGRAFLNRSSVALDPTDSQHLTLKLMLADQSAAAFIARPCYYTNYTNYTNSRSKNCDPSLWTVARYSSEAVGSVNAIVEQLARRYPKANITMVGYSGGGVIALLVARLNSRVSTVITLASPLDIDAWTQLHGYTRLTESINPAAITHWPMRLRQIHVTGTQDSNVPPNLANKLRDQLETLGADAKFIALPGHDHTCCWTDSKELWLLLQKEPETHQ